jgi:REP element-mobilizing transposase RayT
VTASGVASGTIFTCERDREHLLFRLAEVVERLGWVCLAYCLMTTHYHMLVMTPNGDLDRGIQRLNGSYAQAFNRQHERAGHLFGARYRARLVSTETHLLESVRYVHLNPVRALLCRLPEEWTWSSYRALVGLSARPAFLDSDGVLGLFDDDPDRARRALRAFVTDAPDLR